MGVGGVSEKVIREKDSIERKIHALYSVVLKSQMRQVIIGSRYRVFQLLCNRQSAGPMVSDRMTGPTL